MRKMICAGLMLASSISLSGQALAADYVIDKKGAHASINFKVKHLGYSWLVGRFNDFDGVFSYDEKNPQVSSVEVTINPASVDTNHAERDKHLRGDDFLDVNQFKTAKFVSTGVTSMGDGEAVITGDLTLHGVTKSIDIQVTEVGGGKDPWGGYRQGFSGTTTLTMKDFGIDYDLGPASTQVELSLNIEGIRQ